MSDRICIMGQGRIRQTGTPEDLYDRPQSRYVADFVGRSNFIQAVAVGRDGGHLAATAGGLSFRARGGEGIAPGEAVTLSLRPEEVRLAPGGEGHEMEVTHRIFLGEHTEYHLHSSALGHLVAVMARAAEGGDGVLAPGARVMARWRDGAALALAAE